MRFMRIGIGYLAAAYCAGLPVFWVIAASGSNRSWGELILAAPFLMPFGMFMSVPLTIFQSALSITISERFSIRTLLYYLSTGFLTGLTATLILPISQSAPLLKEDLSFYLSFAAAGAVCGAVYWGIAGRKAGLPAQTAGQRMSYIRCLLAGSLFSAALTGAELLILPLNLLREAEAGMAILCFLVYAALGAYIVCAFTQREAAAAAA